MKRLWRPGDDASDQYSQARMPNDARIGFVFLAETVIVLLWATWRGQDVNWDWQNYHLYDAFAFLHGRFLEDVAPAGPQSFLNPLPYLIPYLLRHLPPVWASLLQTATQLPPIFLATVVAKRLTEGETSSSLSIVSAAGLCACTGATVLTEAGTSFCDLALAACPLLALLLILPNLPWRDGPALVQRIFAASGLIGVAIGLKPTNLFLAAALACCAPFLRQRLPRPRDRLLAVLAMPAGLITGIALSDGFWAFQLMVTYRSPIFPFLNTIFRSPSAALVDMGDDRYHWLGFHHALGLPIALARGTVATSENPVRDLRFLLGIILALFVLIRALWLRSAGPLVLPAVWLLVGIFFWALLCPIQRYAVSLEILAGVFVVLVVGRLAVRRWRLPAIMGVAVLLVATTQPADFFHRPWSQAFVAEVPNAIPPNATYGFLTFPLGLWVVAPPRPAHAFSLQSTLMETGGRLQRRLDAIIDQSSDHLWLVNLDTPVDPLVRAEMGIHGIALRPPCLRTQSPVWIDTVFCRGSRVGHRLDGASDLAVGQKVDFSSNGTGLIYELDGWLPAEPDGTWASGRSARLVFMPEVSPDQRSPIVLTLTLESPLAAPPRRVTGQSASRPAVISELPPRQSTKLRLCLGPNQSNGGVVSIKLDTDDIRSQLELGLGPDPRPLAFKVFDMILEPAGSGACPPA